ncbi:MAG: long-chain fatty acid transporter, partial [Cyclobacteriaceae bacterium]|nr:long-chain fatty acid transporter [Cyclobacteriaceae bacterium]
IDYVKNSTYRETEFTYADGTPDDLLREIEITDKLVLDGMGVNSTLGLIVRPISFMTLGASYTTPTYFAINEESEYTFSTDWNTAYSYVAGSDTIDMGFIQTTSDLYISNYGLRTPARVNMGAALFFGKLGFVTADVEVLDYTSAHLKSNDFVVTEDNKAIEQYYRDVVNYRMGAELRMDEIRLRAGYAYQADPYAERSNYDRHRNQLSFGVGYRSDDFFADFTMVNSRWNSFYNPYLLNSNSPEVSIQNRATSASVTFGFVF